MNLPVFKAVAATWAFALQHALELMKIIWLPTLVVAFASYTLTPLLLEAQLNVAHPAGEVDPGVVGDSIRSLLGNGLLLLALSLIASVITTSGILRLVIRGETSKLPVYLGFGRDELYIMLTMLAVGGIIFGTVFGSYVVGFLANAALGTAGGAVFFAVMVGCLVGVIWATSRLSLASAAAVDMQRLGLKPSWQTTNGRVWPLIGFWLLILVPFTLIAMIAGSILAGGGGPQPAGPATTEAARLAMLRETWSAQLEAYRSGAVLPAFIASTLINAVFGAVIALGGGVAWRMLTGDRSAAAVEPASPAN